MLQHAIVHKRRAFGDEGVGRRRDFGCCGANGRTGRRKAKMCCAKIHARPPFPNSKRITSDFFFRVHRAAAVLAVHSVDGNLLPRQGRRAFTDIICFIALTPPRHESKERREGIFFFRFILSKTRRRRPTAGRNEKILSTRSRRRRFIFYCSDEDTSKRLRTTHTARRLCSG